MLDIGINGKICIIIQKMPLSDRLINLNGAYVMSTEPRKGHFFSSIYQKRNRNKNN